MKEEIPDDMCDILPKLTGDSFITLGEEFVYKALASKKKGEFSDEHELLMTLAMSGLLNGVRVTLQIMLDERAELLEDLLEWHRQSPPFKIKM